MENPSGRDKVRIYSIETSSAEEVSKIKKTDQEWRKLLTPEQYRITRLKGTEAPFQISCRIPANEEKGVYVCACCGTALFRHKSKFESGSGWPSFWEPISELNVSHKPDDNMGMVRTEVLCARCDAHLGHVFGDGPPPTGKRYCINAASIIVKELSDKAEYSKATFAAGCFWGVEAAFRKLLGKGVISTRVGYIGGHAGNPVYKEVCSGSTGHAEAVELVYNPYKISYEELLDIFWEIHDATAKGSKQVDTASQYRSVIFFHTPQQEKIARAKKRELQDSGTQKKKIVTQIVETQRFYPAEDYHQRYYEKRGIDSCGCSCVP
ncbi:MAG: peptide-methionine (S)-S-oxide reductase MsrA [Candidatus Omnitrophica bacterium]|nr:peptide-methionine (S)-S-oxide reductase MsrA [Candidatus Omnitrophota bacterium]